MMLFGVSRHRRRANGLKRSPRAASPPRRFRRNGFFGLSHVYIHQMQSAGWAQSASAGRRVARWPPSSRRRGGRRHPPWVRSDRRDRSFRLARRSPWKLGAMTGGRHGDMRQRVSENREEISNKRGAARADPKPAEFAPLPLELAEALAQMRVYPRSFSKCGAAWALLSQSTLKGGRCA